MSPMPCPGCFAVPSLPMRRLSLLLAVLLSLPAAAQKEFFFGSGKPPVFREQDMDRRFKRSKLYAMLEEGTEDPNCVQLLGGLLTALGETAPLLHKKDENFTLDPHLLEAVQTQLSPGGFPGTAYLLSMVRRVLIDGRLPDTWLATAQALNPKVQIIDLGKLKFLNEGVKPVDSFLFSLLALRERFEFEVVRANSAVTLDVESDFRDAYLDRDVAWGNAILVDAGVKKKAKPGKGKGKGKQEPSMQQLIALLDWYPPDPHANEIQYANYQKPPPPIRIIAQLAPRQFIDLEKVPRGKRMLVKGRFWEMNVQVTEVEVREALLFEDRDFSRGVVLADPNAVMACPAAVNQLTGIAPSQPGGFAH